MALLLTLTTVTHLLGVQSSNSSGTAEPKAGINNATTPIG